MRGSASVAASAPTYAKNLFSVTVMPTLRLMVPIGSFEPYASIGLGYGGLPDAGRDGLAPMGRLGFVYRFSEHFAAGLEGTIQQLDGSSYRFPSIGSLILFHPYKRPCPSNRRSP